MSERANEPNTGNKTDVSQECQCQICHRNHIAKRQGEFTHEIVHNASIIAIFHGIDCAIVPASIKPVFYIDQGSWIGEPCSVPLCGSNADGLDIAFYIIFLSRILIAAADIQNLAFIILV